MLPRKATLPFLFLLLISVRVNCCREEFAPRSRCFPKRVDLLLDLVSSSREANSISGKLSPLCLNDKPCPYTVILLFQLMSKDSQMKRRIKRPNTTPSPSRNMDSQSLIGQTMKVQQWLNEKTMKTLQVGDFF